MAQQHFDWIVVGSGFGGSVSALRLAEKGYSVLVLEKGRRFAPGDFPAKSWDLADWIWSPRLGLRGFFQMTFFEHLTALHGVGVGGGSLGYANTLPVPGDGYFMAPSWAHLARWRDELAPYYRTAQRMLGVTVNPHLGPADRVVEAIAADIGRSDHFRPTEVGVFFGTPEQRVPDPYFEGHGPERAGCTLCGCCTTGCRVGAKNTLDMNYLYLAEKRGVQVKPETEVMVVRPHRHGGYEVVTRCSLGRSRREERFSADQVVLAGGVLGTVPLLLAMRADPGCLPDLSPRVGQGVRTNSEALVGVIAPETDLDFTAGVAIGSILHSDEHSHFEAVANRLSSSFLRLLVLPYSPAPTRLGRVANMLRGFAQQPVRWSQAMFKPGLSTKSVALAYMQTLDSTLRLRLKPSWRWPRLATEIDDPAMAPTPRPDGADDLVRRFAEKVDGVPMALATELLSAIPTTAHILGGCCMGADGDSGVIDARHRVHGYPGLYVIDGSAMSANPGVNPSLSITALAERAMSFIPARS